MTHQTIQLYKIKTDGGTQARAALNDDVVTEYAEAITSGANLPPVVVFQDGKKFWLADGFHRYHAHRKAGAIEIDAFVRVGTKRDAILHSVGANASHGLRRTNADKRSAVETLLSDKEWGAWSDREIAKACHVSNTFVSSMRSAVTVNVDSEKSSRKFTNKHGTESTMNVSSIGKGAAPPEAPLPDRDPPEEPVAPMAAPEADSVPSAVATEDSEDPGEFEELTEVEELRQQLVELSDIVEGFDKASLGEREAAAEITRLNGQLRVVESQRDQYMTTCNEIKRTVKALQRENARLLAQLPKAAAA